MKSLLPTLPAPGATPYTGPELSRRGLSPARRRRPRRVVVPEVAGGGLGGDVRAGRAARARRERHLRLPSRRAEPDRHVGPQGRRRGRPPTSRRRASGPACGFPRACSRTLPNHLGGRRDRAVGEGARRSCTGSVRRGSRSRATRRARRAPKRRTWGRSRRWSWTRSAAAQDVLPSFLSLNTQAGLSGAGYFPSSFSPFVVQPTATGLPSLTHPDGAARFATRWNDLEQLDAALRSGKPLGKDASDAVSFYDQAKVLMDTPDVNTLFSYSASDSAALRQLGFRQRLPRRQAAPRRRARRAFHHGLGRRLGHAQQHLRQGRRHEPLHADGPARPRAREPPRGPEGRARQRPPARRFSTRRSSSSRASSAARSANAERPGGARPLRGQQRRLLRAAA